MGKGTAARPAHRTDVGLASPMAHHPAMGRRYDIREDREGWTVFDVFSGEPVVIHGVPQTDLDIQDADELAELLEKPAMMRDRSLRQ